MSKLRGYQDSAIKRAKAAFLQGRRRVLLVSPTGSGKTRMAVEMVLRAKDKGRRVLWLAHRRELVTQAAKRLTQEGLTEYGLFLAEDTKEATDAQVQIASVDTLRARGVFPPADFVVWDEAHHCAAATWKELYRRYPSAWHLGLTATPVRGDGAPLGDMFEELVIGATVQELTRAGHLVPCQVLAPKRQLQGDELARAPLETWKAYAQDKPTLLYALRIEEAHRYARAFQETGILACALDSNTQDKERDEILSRFAAGKIKVLCNVALLTEGWDCPSAEVCLVARTVGTVGLWLQLVGRVLRPSPETGKRRALVIDLVGNAREHGRPDTPRIFTLERGIELDTEAIRQGTKTCPACGKNTASYPCRSCGYLPSLAEKTITGDELYGVDPTPLVPSRPPLFGADPASLAPSRVSPRPPLFGADPYARFPSRPRLFGADYDTGFSSRLPLFGADPAPLVPSQPEASAPALARKSPAAPGPNSRVHGAPWWTPKLRYGYALKLPFDEGVLQDIKRRVPHREREFLRALQVWIFSSKEVAKKLARSYYEDEHFCSCFEKGACFFWEQGEKTRQKLGLQGGLGEVPKIKPPERQEEPLLLTRWTKLHDAPWKVASRVLGIAEHPEEDWPDLLEDAYLAKRQEDPKRAELAYKILRRYLG